MKTRRIWRWSVASGILLTLMGIVWALQGIGVLGGSAMSDDVRWTVIGVPVAAIGIVLAWRGATRP